MRFIYHTNLLNTYQLWTFGDNKMLCKRIKKLEDFSIGQLYMYRESYIESLNKGYCIRITKTSVTFDRIGSVLDDTINLYRDELDGDVYEYNANIFRKYQKLLEQQKKEREDLLNGKQVVVDVISKEKWYKRFLRRKKK